MFRDGMTEPAEGGRDELTRLRGTVEHIIYSNEENGYTVFDLGTDPEGADGGDVITAQGILPYVGEGDTLVLWGRWAKTSEPRIFSCSCSRVSNALISMRMFS